MLSSPSKLLALLLLTGLFCRCQEVAPNAEPFVYVSASRNDVSQRTSAVCAYRYTIANTFARLDNATQREAIRAGFTVWSRINPNVGFLELPDRPEITIQFADPSVVQSQAVPVVTGLVPGSAVTVSALRTASNGVRTVLLSNAHEWDGSSLTKAVAYQVGLILGVATSQETNSIMSPIFAGQPTMPSRADSLAVRSLYPLPCADLANVKFLPCSLKVNKEITQTIKFDKQGTVVIKASGQMTVGIFVGISGPDGRVDGPFGFAILPEYNLIQTIPHAAVMYKVDNETEWRFWKDKPTFSTNGRLYATLTFAINDANLTDNSGAYDVVVDYQ
ncbi:matrixin family metalloprotease [Spirosoma montaniterrae]|nr:matrixin family metalloprotease [Spirosoma montaniterrae]